VMSRSFVRSPQAIFWRVGTAIGMNFYALH
jgi:hypothetical protein